MTHWMTVMWVSVLIVNGQQLTHTLQDDNDGDEGPDQGQDQMDEGSPPDSGDSSDSYQQPLISGCGALYMEYVGGLNQLVLIVDEMSPDGLDGEVLTEVAELIESGVAPVFEECIFDRRLPPPFVRCERCGV